VLQTVYLILVGLWQWNGEWRASLVQQVTLQLTRIHDACRKGRFPPMEWRGISASLVPQLRKYYYYASGVGAGNGNGEWRRCSWIAAHASPGAGSSTLYWGCVWGLIDNGEWRTEQGKIYSALSLRC